MFLSENVLTRGCLTDVECVDESYEVVGKLLRFSPILLFLPPHITSMKYFIRKNFHAITYNIKQLLSSFPNRSYLCGDIILNQHEHEKTFHFFI